MVRTTREKPTTRNSGSVEYEKCSRIQAKHHSYLIRCHVSNLAGYMRRYRFLSKFRSLFVHYYTHNSHVQPNDLRRFDCFQRHGYEYAVVVIHGVCSFPENRPTRNFPVPPQQVSHMTPNGGTNDAAHIWSNNKRRTASLLTNRSTVTRHA